ncbi:MAG: MoaD/ThiS family protein [Phototrophicaceae bacterium]|jgi:molybdopterin converting factor small subunit
MASIKIPTPLRNFTSGAAKVEVNGSTVGEALNHLVTLHPELKQHLYEGDTLRNFVNVFLGEEDVRFLDGVATEIDADASLRIIPSIAGGR